MNIHWRSHGCRYFKAFTAYDERGDVLLTVCERCDDNIREYQGKLTRWCVFADDVYQGYCGDIPINLSEDEVKAAALVLWRLRDQQ